MNIKVFDSYAVLPIATAIIGGGLGLFIASFPFIIYQQEKKSFKDVSLFRAASFSALWMLMTAFHAIKLSPLLLFTPSSVPLLAHKAAGEIATWLGRFYGASVDVIGADKIPADESVIFVANHQSMLDIALLYNIVKRDYRFAWVSKSTVFLIPGVGLIMKLAKYISLERGKKKSVLEMFKECVSNLNDGISVLIFPQGTRDRQHFLPFKDGAFSLAIESKKRIIPISLNVPTNAWTSTKWNAVITIHDPVETQGKDVTVESLKTHCFNVISSCLHVKNNYYA